MTNADRQPTQISSPTAADITLTESNEKPARSQLRRLLLSGIFLALLLVVVVGGVFAGLILNERLNQANDRIDDLEDELAAARLALDEQAEESEIIQEELHNQMLYTLLLVHARNELDKVLIVSLQNQDQQNQRLVGRSWSEAVEALILAESYAPEDDVDRVVEMRTALQRRTSDGNAPAIPKILDDLDGLISEQITPELE
jgi:hypothetical protein